MAVPDVCASFMVLQNSGKVGVKLWEVGTVKKVDYIHKAHIVMGPCINVTGTSGAVCSGTILQLDSCHKMTMQWLYMYHFKSWLFISDFVSVLLEGELEFHMRYDATMTQNSIINAMSAYVFGNQEN